MALSVDDRLRCIGIPIVSRCDCCHEDKYEDQNHVLFEGEFAKELWHYYGATFGLPLGLTWREMAIIWFRRAPSVSQVGLIVGLLPSIITWHLWRRICTARMEGSIQSISSVWLSIRSWMRLVSRDMKKVSKCSRHDLQILQILNILVLVPNRKFLKLVAWQKPAQGWFKLKTNGSSLGNPGSSGVGGIIRNERGHMVYAFNSHIGFGSNNIAELLAILQGLKAYKDLGINFVEIELNSQVVISWWNRRRCGVWYLEDFWEDTLALMDSMVASRINPFGYTGFSIFALLKGFLAKYFSMSCLDVVFFWLEASSNCDTWFKNFLVYLVTPGASL
ncbi:uncharacterized protein LOC121253465 [Juglans microcarpa x Juglans regia]|uniref:uncharacterized protein LOC121253465 n=1 Tax=Juglans microcarpa x Juglans regia TaxID=2249226 RepID=UPI001B7DED70|nr:uncharacterized protein LOC121253465 [Juglans microcarpa x Juglans regia]